MSVYRGAPSHQGTMQHAWRVGNDGQLCPALGNVGVLNNDNVKEGGKRKMYGSQLRF